MFALSTLELLDWPGSLKPASLPSFICFSMNFLYSSGSASYMSSSIFHKPFAFSYLLRSAPCHLHPDVLVHVLRYVWPIFAPSPTVCEGILLTNIGCCAVGCFDKILHFSHVLHEQYRTKLNRSSVVVESLDRCHYRNGFRLFDVYAMCCCVISYYYYYYHFNNNTTSTSLV